MSPRARLAAPLSLSLSLSLSRDGTVVVVVLFFLLAGGGAGYLFNGMSLRRKNYVGAEEVAVMQLKLTHTCTR
jgi:hypothetical protein